MEIMGVKTLAQMNSAKPRISNWVGLNNHHHGRRFFQFEDLETTGQVLEPNESEGECSGEVAGRLVLLGGSSQDS